MTIVHPVHFYDSAAPGNIPSGVNAAVYVNGFAWQQHDIMRMARVFRISVRREPSWAKLARCLDIETGAAEPQDFVPFAKYRLALGFNDATAYVNRSNWGLVKELVKEADLHFHGRPWEPLYWVATLGGTPVLQNEPGVWAEQYWGGMTSPYDLSVLYGVDNLHRP